MQKLIRTNLWQSRIYEFSPLVLLSLDKTKKATQN
jgi:hypothetical protein